MINNVFVTRTAACLPLDPVTNDEIESVLGRVGGRPSRARAIVLRNNGITHRHYALDRSTGEPVMTNAQLAAAAIRGLGEIGPVECLAAATSVADQILPGHASMVHGEIGWPSLEAVSLAGVCLSGTAALRYAAMAVACGARRAVASASELVSPLLHASRFEAEVQARVDALERNPEIAFEKDFLRWMLSDGAGAMLLEPTPGDGQSLRIDWIELFSQAHKLPACMYLGADREPDGTLRGWMRQSPADWHMGSTFALKQDVRLLDAHIAQATIIDPVEQIRERRGLAADDVDWFLPHLSSMYFAPRLEKALAVAGLPIPRERWFTNLVTCGNTGSASPYIMLDALIASKQLRSGQRVLLFIPESGRFASGFVQFEVV
ncbi:MAG: beta-ketoacyl-ACP synthase III [Burkholderiaceae bacterium]